MSKFSDLITSSAYAPAAYFRCGEAAGLGSPFTAADSFGNNVAATYRNNGSNALLGVTLGKPGAIPTDTNTAAAFDGTNGLIVVTNNSTPIVQNTITVGGAINVTAFPGSGNASAFLGAASGQADGGGNSSESYRLVIVNTSGTLAVSWGSFDAVLTIFHGASWNIANWNAGEWHLLYGTYDGEYWRIFFDGQEVASSPDSVGPIATTNGRLFIGAEQFYVSNVQSIARLLNGQVDEVVVSPIAWTRQQIAALSAAYSVLSVGILTPLSLGPTVILQSGVPLGGVGVCTNQLQRSSTGGGTGFSNVGAPTQGTSYTDNTATPGSTYYWRVATTDSTGATATSPEFSSYVRFQRQANFLNAGFGVFFHWNIETFYDNDVLPGSATITNIFGNANGATGGASGPVTVNTYSGISGPNFDNWIAAAAASGAKFVLLTVSHGNGFRLWNSASSPHNIANTTWGQANPSSLVKSTDLLTTFIAKAHAAGMLAGFYFSCFDRFQQANASTYPTSSYVPAAVTELMGYLPDVMYLDNFGAANSPFSGNYNAANILGILHSANPLCAALSNDTLASLTTSDVVEYEQPAGVPSAGSPPYGAGAGASLPGVTAQGDFPLQYRTTPTNETTTVQLTDASGNWPYFDHNGTPTLWTASQLIALRKRCMALGASFLLNCPPNRSGTLPTATATLLANIGPGYSVATSTTTPVLGSTVTLTITKTTGIFSTGNVVTATDEAGGVFGTFAFTSGQAIGTITYTPVASGSRQVIFSNNLGLMDAPVKAIAVSTASVPAASSVTDSAGSRVKKEFSVVSDSAGYRVSN